MGADGGPELPPDLARVTEGDAPLREAVLAAMRRGRYDELGAALRDAFHRGGCRDLVLAELAAGALFRSGAATAATEFLLLTAVLLVDQRRDAEALEVFYVAWVLDFQHLLQRFVSDRALAKRIGVLYSVVAQRNRPAFLRPPVPAGPGLLRVGYVAPNIVDHWNAPTKVLRSLLLAHDPARCQVNLYLAETFMRRHKPLFSGGSADASSYARGALTLDRLAQSGIPIYLTPNRGSFLDSAAALASKIQEDRIDVLVYQCSIACTIECVVAAWRPARLQLNFNQGAPMFVRELDGVLYFIPSVHEDDLPCWQGEPSRPYLVPRGGMDLDEDLRGTPPTRASLGVPEDAVVFLTTSNHLSVRLGSEFVGLVTEVLRRVPKGWYVAVGDAAMTAQRRRFQEGGVADRVTFVGPTVIAPLFNRMADVYLNEVPAGGGASVLEAMAAGRPVVAMRSGAKHLQCAGAGYVGAKHAIEQADPSRYVDLAVRLAGDPALRAEFGSAMRRRYETDFTGKALAEEMEKAFDYFARQS